MKLNLDHLYQLVKTDPEKELTEQELRFINTEVLSFLSDYLQYITVDEIKEIFELSLAFWLNHSNELDLEELKDRAWQINSQLYEQSKWGEYDEIILRILITTLYDDKNKENMEQSLEFIAYKVDELRQLGQSWWKGCFLKTLYSVWGGSQRDYANNEQGINRY